MIDSLPTVKRAIAMLPKEVIKSVTLNSRQTRETAATTAPYTFARRLTDRSAVDRIEVLMAGAIRGEEWIVLELFKVTETVTPKQGDSITDWESVTWQVKKVCISMMGRVFQCLCLKNK